MLSWGPLSQLFCVVFHAFIFEYCCEANYFSSHLESLLKESVENCEPECWLKTWS